MRGTLDTLYLCVVKVHDQTLSHTTGMWLSLAAVCRRYRPSFVTVAIGTRLRERISSAVMDYGM
jgi:hypothetical protein